MKRMTGEAALRAMLDAVPEFAEWIPTTIVLDAFADYVADRIQDGAPAATLAPYFDYVEDLAARGDRDLDNAVIVSFLEAAPWGELGARELLGPHTRTLARRADPRLIDTTML